MAVAPTQGGAGMTFDEQMKIQQQMLAQQRYEGTMGLMMQKQSETQSEGFKRLSNAQANAHSTNSEIISNTRTK